jgi:anti-sigma factor (TIGR02949 family)
MSRLDRYTCEEALRRLDDYLDRELRPDEMQHVQEHLETCAVCAKEFAFEASVIGVVRTKLQRIDVPADLRTRLARLLEAERAAGWGDASWTTT